MVKISVVSALLFALLTLPACRRESRNENPDTPPPPVASAPSAPAPVAASTTDHAEVFRRAFWRHPTSADRILEAERRVHPTDGSWQWFIQLHPSPELLAALRDPDTFGLIATTAPRPWSDPSESPAWFPIPATLADAGFEILQAHASGLTVLYRASDDTLFSTDTGSGFAPPAR